MDRRGEEEVQMGSKPDTGAHASVKEGAAALFAGREKETEVKAAVAPPPPSDMMIDDLMFTGGVFPSLPDFPCLSSPSESPSMSTSATSSQPKTASFSKTSSSSSSSSWSFLKFTAENDGMQIVPVNDDPAVQSTDSVELLRQESVGFDIQGVLDASWESGDPPSESWNPTSFFLGETSGVGGGDDEVGFLGAGKECQSEDLAKVFLEWLKDNKDSISPEDLRNIKLKRSTIGCAASRLGGGKQGRVQLLKLILAWVQNHHLQRKRRRSRGAAAGNRIIDHDFPAAAPSPMIPAAYIDEASATPAYQYYPDLPFSPLLPDFHSAEQVPVAWHQGLSPASLSVHYSPFGPARASPRLPPSEYHAGFASHFTGAQPLYSPALGVVRPPSATKEARKNRMARHRKLSSLHHNRSHQQHQQQQNSDTAIAIGEGSNSPTGFKKEIS